MTRTLLLGLLALVATGTAGCATKLEPSLGDPAGVGAGVGPRTAAREAAADAPSSSPSGSRTRPRPPDGSALDAGPEGSPDGGLETPEAIEPPDGPEENPPVRRVSAWYADRALGGVARMEAAQRAREGLVRELFAQAGASFPPAQLLLRAFKRERRLEVWAESRLAEPFRHVTTYQICFASGRLGPKRRQGDGQVPEGFYTLGYLNPSSPYHLAMLVTYPNESDRILGDKHDPGGEIMIHGDCVSAGCLAMSDERIEELWVMATSVLWRIGGKVHVHILPSRDMEQLLGSSLMPEHHELWANLKEGLDAFEREKRLPRIEIDRVGRYHFR
jgi:hypothetical protein